ncbi:hypothetical protein [Aquimarina sp. 433]
MRDCFTHILFFSMIHVFAQSHKEYTPIIEDFNKDGVKDTLYAIYDGGSNFGGTDVKLINGKNTETYELSNFGCFCAMTTLHWIPDALQKSENQLFLSAIQKRLFPKVQEVADPSLEWIIKGKSSNRKFSKNKYFDLIIYPDISWDSVPIVVPKDNYSMILDEDMIKMLFPEEIRLHENNAPEVKKGFLSYCGRCHQMNESSPELVTKNDLYEVFKTSHGVYVRKKDLQKWILVNEINLTGSVGKLRWDSIKKVVLLDTYLVIQFSGAPDYFDTIFVSNVETGMVGRLKYLYRDNTLDYPNVLVKDQMIRYVDEEEEKSFFLNANEVFEELDSLHLRLKD